MKIGAFVGGLAGGYLMSRKLGKKEKEKKGKEGLPLVEEPLVEPFSDEWSGYADGGLIRGYAHGGYVNSGYVAGHCTGHRDMGKKR